MSNFCMDVSAGGDRPATDQTDYRPTNCRLEQCFKSRPENDLFTHSNKQTKQLFTIYMLVLILVINSKIKKTRKGLQARGLVEQKVE